MELTKADKGNNLYQNFEEGKGGIVPLNPPMVNPPTYLREAIAPNYGLIDPLAVWPSIRLTATIAAVNRLLTTQQSK